MGCSSKTNTYEKSCFYVDKFNYNNPVPYSDEVDETYFDNTLIAGDSRVGSLVLYNKLKNLKHITHQEEAVVQYILDHPSDLLRMSINDF